MSLARNNHHPFAQTCCSTSEFPPRACERYYSPCRLVDLDLVSSQKHHRITALRVLTRPLKSIRCHTSLSSATKSSARSSMHSWRGMACHTSRTLEPDHGKPSGAHFFLPAANPIVLPADVDAPAPRRRVLQRHQSVGPEHFCPSLSFVFSRLHTVRHSFRSL